MQSLKISAVQKPLILGAWFLILAASPFVFPNHNVPLWTSGIFLFFAFIILIQPKKYELSGNQILMKNFVLGNTVIIERGEMKYIAVALMPKTIASRLGLMKRGRMATVMSKDKIKINIASTTTGHLKFNQVEIFLRNNYSDFFKN